MIFILSFRRLILALLMATTGSICLAVSSEPMRFEAFTPCLGNGSFCATRVLARGVIQLDSADGLAKFLKREAIRDKNFNPSPVIVFDSPGGNLAGGMALGRLIRSLKLDTVLAPKYTEEVVDKSPDGYRERVVAKDAICVSACSMAFIGGISRGLEEGARFGVHQFASAKGSISEGASQITVTALSSYVNEMGVDRRMIDLASLTSPNEIFWISASDSRKLRIDNTVMVLNDWLVAVDNGGAPTVHVTQKSTPGHSTMLFLRADPQGGLRLFVTSSFELAHTKMERLLAFPVDEIPTIRLVVNGRQVIKLTSQEPWRYKIDDAKQVVSFVGSAPLARIDLEALRRAKTLKIDDDFPHVVQDLSMATDLSTESLAGGISLLLRSK